MSRYRRLLLLGMIAAFSFCVPSVSPAHAGFWERLQKVYEDVRKFFSRTAGDVEKGLDHFGREFEKEFCDFFTAGRASRGEAGCGINGGVGVDKEGVYTYDPQQPDQKFRGLLATQRRQKKIVCWASSLALFPRVKLGHGSTRTKTSTGFDDFCPLMLCWERRGLMGLMR